MDLGFGALGPLFADGSFEYIPIPENPERASSRTIMFFANHGEVWRNCRTVLTKALLGKPSAL